MRQPPTPADLRVPSNLIEHIAIVATLMAGGSLHSEAELMIAARKTAYNRSTVAGSNIKKIEYLDRV